MKKTHLDFIQHVEEHRKNKLTQDKAKREEVIYNADVFLGRKSVELGYEFIFFNCLRSLIWLIGISLADNLGDYQSVLHKEFPKANIVNITSKSPLQMYKETLGLAINFLQSNNSVVTMTPEEQKAAILSKYHEYFKK